MDTFPEKSFDSVSSYSLEYFSKLANAHSSIDHSMLTEASTILNKAFKQGAWLYVCGNGGSASIANHLLCDFAKGIQTDTPVKPRVISLSANLELITAIANDIDYDDCFVYQLNTSARKGDVLLTISSSGDSENIVRAVEWAKENHLQTISLTGFGGGRTAKKAKVNIHVNANNYGIVEDTHQSIMHIFSQYLRQSNMTEELIRKRKF